MKYDPDQGYPIRGEDPKVVDLGMALSRAVAKIVAGEVSPHSLYNLPAVQPREWTDADSTIPERVWSNWIPSLGRRELKRALTVDERRELIARRDELTEGLRSYLPSGDKDEFNSILGGLLGGYRSMRHEGEDVEAVLAVLQHVLRDFPLWAISEGCRRIVMNEAGLDPRWPPNDAQIHAVVKSVVKSYKLKLDVVTDVLQACIESSPIPEEHRPQETWEQTKADLQSRGFSCSEKPRITESAGDVMKKFGISKEQWDAIPNLPMDHGVK